ncbi:hypothetical protein [Polynucleobacter sp. JS-Polo-80-F4]|uniref:hypothetical protein n=1 Tax=Polynucleobacter sp. JS-Polo-80-F4 TaxID=2576918 RepID=UPI001C0CA3B5|nr:hypothetical protein [Polynucleobacter sp. JS-Polo-80-F4]MBU3617327.1 hypothetical protein [Polynucleobacter sp. JS-Polo-80-F4]
MNSLYRCADDVQDWFRRLGGANQYSGFMNWHIPAFVLLVTQNKIGSELLPDVVWRNTQELQATIKMKLTNNTPTEDDISEFINETARQSTRFKDKREGSEWLEFCQLVNINKPSEY